MPVIPGINKDITLISKDLNEKIHEPKHQRNLVLIIVCIALLLDNMLYMVIVPIIPEHLHKIEMEEQARLTTRTTLSIHHTMSPMLGTNLAVNTKLNSKNVKDDDSDSNESGEKKATKQQSSVGRGNVKAKSATAISLLNASPHKHHNMSATPNPKKLKEDADDKEDIWVGLLFASKAMVQLVIGPFRYLPIYSVNQLHKSVKNFCQTTKILKLLFFVR